MLQPGRYTVGFPLARLSEFRDWTKANLGDVNVWAVRSIFAIEHVGHLGNAAPTVVHFEVFSPVEWGALPAPDVLN